MPAPMALIRAMRTRWDPRLYGLASKVDEKTLCTESVVDPSQDAGRNGAQKVDAHPSGPSHSHRRIRTNKMLWPWRVGRRVLCFSPNRCCSSGDVLQWRGSLHPWPPKGMKWRVRKARRKWRTPSPRLFSHAYAQNTPKQGTKHEACQTRRVWREEQRRSRKRWLFGHARTQGDQP